MCKRNFIGDFFFSLCMYTIFFFLHLGPLKNREDPRTHINWNTHAKEPQQYAVWILSSWERKTEPKEEDSFRLLFFFLYIPPLFSYMHPRSSASLPFIHFHVKAKGLNLWVKIYNARFYRCEDTVWRKKKCKDTCENWRYRVNKKNMINL